MEKTLTGCLLAVRAEPLLHGILFINTFRLISEPSLNDTKIQTVFHLVYDITFINERYWFRGNESLYGVEIRSTTISRRSFRKMIGKPFYSIRLMYRFILVKNISEQACQNAINHICCELSGFESLQEILLVKKPKFFFFQTVVGD